MKNLRLLFLFLVGLVSFPAFPDADNAPEIIFLGSIGNGASINGMSANGRWVLSGSTVYDMSTSPIQSRSLGNGRANDISDDGKTAIGSCNGGPGVWKEGIGWKSLPTPPGQRGGRGVKLTPDGRYGVGVTNQDGCMWDLSTMEIVELPNRPLTDRRGPYDPDPNNFVNYYENISPDGRYVQGILSWIYVGDQTAYIYDRETEETHYIGFKKRGEGDFIPDDPAIHYTECNGMSADGHYVTGVAYILHGPEYLTAYRYDVWNDEFEYFDGPGQQDAWGFSVSNDGLVFLRQPGYNPYNDGFVCYNNFFYAFADILTLGYGINLDKYGIENTGTPVLCSADGQTIAFYSYESGYYLVRFKEPIQKACDNLKLLKSWKPVPSQNSIMTYINEINIEFNYPVEAIPSSYLKIKLVDENDNFIANPLANGGISANANKLRILFRSREMEEGKEYRILIPEGVCNVKGLPGNTNDEIVIKYSGRNKGPVKPVKIFPKEGSTVSSIDIKNDPILITFDANLKLNTGMEDPLYLYIDDNPRPVSHLYAGLYNENTLAVFPLYEMPLYKGSVYTVKIPANIVTDISGAGASEAIEISYEGIYVNQVTDEKYIFKSDCSNFDNFMFYEGDYGNPVAEYYGMGFTSDTTPWWAVRDNETSTDLAFGSHSCYTDGRASNDWVTTRRLYIPDETAYLAFDGQSYRKNKTDVLKVYVYATDAVINSLSESIINEILNNADLVFDEALKPGPTEGGIDGEWTHYVIPLNKYAGKNIYICFANLNQGQSLVMIDNIEVSRTVDSFISLTNTENVVALESVEIKGHVVVENELADYKTLNLQLKDKDRKVISSIKAAGLSLKAGDTFEFTFPDKLPLTIGEVNDFYIDFSLDEELQTYRGTIRNLIFEPVKKVVLEEFTGRDCPFCPQGQAMIEKLGELFPNNFIPIALYCYMGTDPKGYSVMNYYEFLGMTAAPSGRINRRPITMAMYGSEILNRYVYSDSELPESEHADLWFDDVIEELKEPAFIEVNAIDIKEPIGDKMQYVAQFRSAVNLSDQNLRVFGVLVENNIPDYQVNGLYNIKDPLLGEWGAGGSLGSDVVTTTFDHAARATWGTGYNGTANVLPTSLKAGETYTVEMSVNVPQVVENRENCEFIVMLIDGNTGRILNADVAHEESGVRTVNSDMGAGINISVVNGNLNVCSDTKADVKIYNVSGTAIFNGNGEGCFQVPMNGYKGIAIVTVSNSGATVTKKIVF